mgnify:CR=1 FL=1
MLKYVSSLLGVVLLIGSIGAKSINIPNDARGSYTRQKQGVPHEINYQGWLGNANDTTGVTGTFDMTFTLYDAETGGTALWTETHVGVKVDKGVFNVLLGSINSIPADIFTGGPLWLEIKVGDETLSPRKKLVSVGYAIQTENAENAIYADTANYALTANIGYVDSARVSGNAWKWAGKSWGDEYPKSNRADTATYADTAKYAVVTNINYVDSAGVAGNAWKWANKSWGDEYPKTNRADTAIYADTANYAKTDNDWVIIGNILYPSSNCGLAMRQSNVLYGDSAYTHINFGASCTTGAAGHDFLYCVVLGGRDNVASSNYTTVSGGLVNKASGLCATVGGGYENLASTYYATVSGGRANTASSAYAAVSGGYSNTASSSYAIVSGGMQNNASGLSSTVSGGSNNTASGWHATVSGGKYNIASDSCTVVGGGYCNIASAPYATVSGGDSCYASGWWSTVGGGLGDTASGDAAVVGGGYSNTASKWAATVSGGCDNTASASYATVGGGESNTASDWHATVSGGESNKASGSCATVGGGWYNTASGTKATVGGGQFNTASASYATVSGGDRNVASGYCATVAGGYGDTVSGSYSFATGYKVRVHGDTSFGFGSNFSTSDTNVVVFYAPSGMKVGINTPSPESTLHVMGNLYVQGNMRVTGAKNAVVNIDGKKRLIYCQESPEVWVEDFGSGKLVNGRAHIELDPTFLKTVTINEEHPMQVFIQLYGDCNGVYVVRGKTGFDVIELRDGKSNVEFGYRVVAKRKGFEDKRFEFAK